MSTEGDATFSVHRVESLPHASETVVYFETSALDETVRDLKARGFSFSQEPRDEPWLSREVACGPGRQYHLPLLGWFQPLEPSLANALLDFRHC